MTAPATLTVSSSLWRPLSPDLYSVFLETEINFGGEGGLYAELLHNRDFEALGRGRLGPHGVGLQAFYDLGTGRPLVTASAGLDPHEPAPDPTSYQPWRPVGRPEIAVDNATAPFATNPHSLRVCGQAGDGVLNPGYWGIGARAGIGFTLRLFARALNIGGIRLEARVSVGRRVLTVATIQVPGATGRWHELTATLPPPNSSPRSRCRHRGQSCAERAVEASVDGGGDKWERQQGSESAHFELVLLEEGEVWIDGVSLMPADAVAGIFRKDIFETIGKLQPAFLRSPGGNYLEGHGPRTRWDWKATVGPPAARRGHYNTAWGYWVTDGLGVLELLLLSELLGCASQVPLDRVVRCSRCNRCNRRNGWDCASSSG